MISELHVPVLDVGVESEGLEGSSGGLNLTWWMGRGVAEFSGDRRSEVMENSDRGTNRGTVGALTADRDVRETD